jgi:2-polyprenyl-6-methoxyphenol hydroxylase-like FAD-dependent oxidoreductase
MLGFNTRWVIFQPLGWVNLPPLLTLTLVKPTLSKSNVVFIGDAAHACSPMLQQGAASAFEDSIAISRFLTEFENIQMVIEHYNQFRMPRIEWVRENSDTPLKRISACITDDDYKIRNRFIVENGPTNVSKWKILSGESFIDSMNSYLSSIESMQMVY